MDGPGGYRESGLRWQRVRELARQVVCSLNILEMLEYHPASGIARYRLQVRPVEERIMNVSSRSRSRSDWKLRKGVHQSD